jgi:hypothetical protein
VVEKEDMSEDIIKETLLLMVVEVMATKGVVKDLEEKLTRTEMCDRAGEMIPFAESTEDILMDNATIIQEGKISVHQEITVAMEMDADVPIIVDLDVMTIVHHSNHNTLVEEASQETTITNRNNNLV